MNRSHEYISIDDTVFSCSIWIMSSNCICQRQLRSILSHVPEQASSHVRSISSRLIYRMEWSGFEMSLLWNITVMMNFLMLDTGCLRKNSSALLLSTTLFSCSFRHHRMIRVPWNWIWVVEWNAYQWQEFYQDWYGSRKNSNSAVVDHSSKLHFGITNMSPLDQNSCWYI